MRGVRLLTLITISFWSSTSSQKTFEEYRILEKRFDSQNKIDSLNTVLRDHLTSAIQQTDTLEQLKVLRWMYWYSEEENDSKNIQNSISELMINVSNKREEALNLYTYGSKKYYKGDYKTALELFQNSLTISQESGSSKEIVDNIVAISGIYRELRKHQYVDKFLEESLTYIQSKFPDDSKTLSYLIYLEIAKNSIESSSYGKALINMELATKNVLLENWGSLDHKLVEAQINFYNGNIIKARDTLSKYVRDFEVIDLPITHYILSLCYKKIPLDSMTNSHLIKTDSVLDVLDYPPFNNGASLYEQLLSQTNNEDLKNEYLGKSIFYNQSTRKNESLNLEKLRLKSHSKFPIIPIILLCSTGFVLSAFYVRKRRKSITQYSDQKRDLAKSNHKAFIGLKNMISEWEANEGYLETGITLTSLAVKFNTNTAYLSYVFNNLLGISFSDFLAEKRVKYLISFVRNNPHTIKEKSRIQLAEMIGFQSIDAYNSAFKKQTGKTPKQYFSDIY